MVADARDVSALLVLPEYVGDTLSPKPCGLNDLPACHLLAATRDLSEMGKDRLSLAASPHARRWLNSIGSSDIGRRPTRRCRLISAARGIKE